MVCLLNSIHGKIGIFIFEQKVQECGAEVEDRSPRWTMSYCIIIITIMIIITVYELGNDVRLGNGPCTNKSNHKNTAGAPVLTVIRVKIANVPEISIVSLQRSLAISRYTCTLIQWSHSWEYLALMWHVIQHYSHRLAHCHSLLNARNCRTHGLRLTLRCVQISGLI